MISTPNLEQAPPNWVAATWTAPLVPAVFIPVALVLGLVTKDVYFIPWATAILGLALAWRLLLSSAATQRGIGLGVAAGTLLCALGYGVFLLNGGWFL